MAKFCVNGHVTISAYTIVEADTAEEAREVAWERPMSDLGFRPCTSEPDEAWVVEEIDGEPQVLDVEEWE